MTNREVEPTVRPSVLDRLIDREPRIGGDRSLSWGESVQQLKASLRRDLEWLLNTRQIIVPASDAFPEVQRSAYQLGLPDITSLSGDSELVRRQLVRRVEECIRAFEPRLMNVQVSLLETDNENRRQIRFVIEALLRLDPNPERVTFDTLVETSSGKILLSRDGHA